MIGRVLNRLRRRGPRLGLSWALVLTAWIVNLTGTGLGIFFIVDDHLDAGVVSFFGGVAAAAALAAFGWTYAADALGEARAALLDPWSKSNGACFGNAVFGMVVTSMCLACR